MKPNVLTLSKEEFLKEIVGREYDSDPVAAPVRRTALAIINTSASYLEKGVDITGRIKVSAGAENPITVALFKKLQNVLSAVSFEITEAAGVKIYILPAAGVKCAA